MTIMAPHSDEIESGVKYTQCAKSEEESVAPKESLVGRVAANIRSQTIQCLISTIVIAVILGACIVFYYTCHICLLGVVIFSGCMCPYVPFFNFPLWISILLIGIIGLTSKSDHISIVLK